MRRNDMMRRRTLAISAGLGVLLVLAHASSPAHHGVASYDMDTVLTLEGRVEEWRWQSPHTSLTVRGFADARARVRRIEGAPPPWMDAQGWTPGSLEAGESVVVTYHPASTPGGRWDGILMAVERADGELLEVNRPAWLGGP